MTPAQRDSLTLMAEAPDNDPSIDADAIRAALAELARLRARAEAAEALADAVDESISWFDDGGTRAGESTKEDLVAALATYRDAR